MVLPAAQDVVEQQGVTRFIDDAKIEESVGSPYTTIARLGDTSSIIEFLQRPERIYSGRINSSTVSLKPLSVLAAGSQTPIKTFDFPYDALTPSKIAKLDYYRWLKCDVKVRVQIAANPFVAGRLLITVAPQDEFVDDRHQIQRKGIRSLTSYPSLEMDLQTATAGEIMVPWCGTGDAIDISQPIAYGKYARVSIWLISPLQVASNSPSSSVPIQVYVSLANVDLRLPTPHRVSTAPVVAARLQVNGKREVRGPISEISSKIARASSALKDVPVIGSVASSAEWISNLTSNVASVFGWSRPVVGPTNPVVNVPGRGFNNFKSDDASVVLGMHSDNSIVESHNISPDAVDEMQVSYACARPGLARVREWKKTAEVDETIFGLQVGPNVDEDNFTSEGNFTVVDMTVGDYVMSKFGYWRADVHFRISIVKTAFHVGRLEVYYSPKTGGYNPTGDDTTNCYREIFDITDKDEIEFVVPYSSANVLCSTVSSHDNLGYLQVRVVAPLTSPDTVSDSVYIHAWKWYENVAVACPIGIGLPTWNGEIPAVKATLQINTSREQVSPNIVFGQVNDEASLIDACGTVCGEMCVNLREATRGFRETKKMNGNKTVLCWIGSKFGGYLEMCSNIYAFYRGGLSFKVVPIGTGIVLSHIVTESDDRHIPSDLPTHITSNAVTPIHEVTVPFYCPVRRLPCNAKVTDASAYTVPTLSIEYEGTGITGSRWFVAGKDDLTFSFLIGPPVLVFIDPSKAK